MGWIPADTFTLFLPDIVLAVGGFTIAGVIMLGDRWPRRFFGPFPQATASALHAPLAARADIITSARNGV